MGNQQQETELTSKEEELKNPPTDIVHGSPYKIDLENPPEYVFIHLPVNQLPKVSKFGLVPEEHGFDSEVVFGKPTIFFHYPTSVPPEDNVLLEVPFEHIIDPQSFDDHTILSFHPVSPRGLGVRVPVSNYDEFIQKQES